MASWKVSTSCNQVAVHFSQFQHCKGGAVEDDDDDVVGQVHAEVDGDEKENGNHRGDHAVR